MKGSWYCASATKWLVLLGLGCVLAFGQQAWGYILPVRHYFKQYLTSRAYLPRLTIKQTTTEWVGGKKQTYEERVWIRVPAQVRVERWVKGERVRVDLWRKTEHLLWKKGGSTTTNKRRPQVAYDLFAVERTGSGYASLRNLVRWLRVSYGGLRRWSRDSDYREQINVHLSWFQQAPTVVFGRKPTKSQSSNQLWFHKKHVFPVRFLGGYSPSGARVDVRFLDYHVRGGVSAFPGRTLTYRNGRLVKQVLVYSVKTTSIPSSLFMQVP